jgi:hypothetical protein
MELGTRLWTAEVIYLSIFIGERCFSTPTAVSFLQRFFARRFGWVFEVQLGS